MPQKTMQELIDAHAGLIELESNLRSLGAIERKQKALVVAIEHMHYEIERRKQLPSKAKAQNRDSSR